MEVCHCEASVQHQLNWHETRVLDRAIQLNVKEALHIQRTHVNNRLDCYELTGC